MLLQNTISSYVLLKRRKFLVQNNVVSVNRFLKQDRFTRLPSAFIKNYKIIMHTLRRINYQLLYERNIKQWTRSPHVKSLALSNWHMHWVFDMYMYMYMYRDMF